MNNYINPLVEEITSKFLNAGALSKETSKSLNDIGITTENSEYKLAFNYLKSMWYIRKYKGCFYLDENALTHPLKTVFKKFLLVFAIVFPIMIIILSIVVLLIEFKLI